MADHRQFIRIRLLGKLFHCKSKNKKNDLYKRHGNPRIELCFAVHTRRHQRAITRIIKEFEQNHLDDMILYH